MCLQKNLWKFKQILKILFKNLKVFKKNFESFKENVNKHFEKLNENYNFLLLFILIAGWDLGCSPSFAIVPGFWGKLPPSPPAIPLVYTVQCTCTMKFPNFLNFQSNSNKYPIQINMLLIFTVFPLVEEGKSCVVLTGHEWNH